MLLLLLNNPFISLYIVYTVSFNRSNSINPTPSSKEIFRLSQQKKEDLHLNKDMNYLIVIERQTDGTHHLLRLLSNLLLELISPKR